MTPNLTELRKLAEEARDSKCNCSFYARGPHPAPTDIANLGRAANPATILALLNLVEELRKAEARIAKLVEAGDALYHHGPESYADELKDWDAAKSADSPGSSEGDAKPSLSTPNPEREEGGR